MHKKNSSRPIWASKLHNMIAISKYYNSTPGCTLLFDDKASNTRPINMTGFRSVQVGLQGPGISPQEADDGLKILETCNGKQTSTVIVLFSA